MQGWQEKRGGGNGVAGAGEDEGEGGDLLWAAVSLFSCGAVTWVNTFRLQRENASLL